MRKWNGLPYPAFMAGLASILSLLTAAQILHSAILLQYLGHELGLSTSLIFFWVWGLVWIITGVGLWLEQNWSRLLFRLIATCALLYGIYMTCHMASISEQPFNFGGLAGPAFLTFISWQLRFWAEWPVFSVSKRFTITLKCFSGWLKITQSQIGRLFGRSFYRWSDDPILVAAGCMSRDEIRETLAIPEADGPGWIQVATMQFPSGTVLLCDWGLLGDWEHSGVRVSIQSDRQYILELQVARLRSSYGICTLRARIISNDFVEALSQHRGNIPVDFGGIAICDINDLQQILSKPDITSQLKNLGFGQLPYLGKDILPDSHGTSRVFAFPSGFGDGYYDVFSTKPDVKSFCLLIDMTD